MSHSMLALLGFATWTVLVLLCCIGAQRIYLILRRGWKPNAFTAAGTEVSPRMERCARAHMNCIENLPVLTAFVLLAYMTDQLAITDRLALIFLAARAGQTIVHVISGSNNAVRLRFTFFLVQVVIYLVWAFQLGSYWLTASQPA